MVASAEGPGRRPSCQRGLFLVLLGELARGGGAELLVLLASLEGA